MVTSVLLQVDLYVFLCYSFHEMGIYDVPATVNFILQETKQNSFYYVGHSQGATIGKNIVLALFYNKTVFLYLQIKDPAFLFSTGLSNSKKMTVCFCWLLSISSYSPAFYVSAAEFSKSILVKNL